MRNFNVKTATTGVVLVGVLSGCTGSKYDNDETVTTNPEPVPECTATVDRLISNAGGESLFTVANLEGGECANIYGYTAGVANEQAIGSVAVPDNVVVICSFDKDDIQVRKADGGVEGRLDITEEVADYLRQEGVTSCPPQQA